MLMARMSLALRSSFSVFPVSNFCIRTKRSSAYCFSIFLNNSSGTLTYGNNAIATAAPVGPVWGVYNDPDVAGAAVPATSNRMFNPTGLLISGTDLLLADTMNFAVRKLDLSAANGTVATVTGGLAAKHRSRSEAAAAEESSIAELYLVDQMLYDDFG